MLKWLSGLFARPTAEQELANLCSRLERWKELLPEADQRFVGIMRDRLKAGLELLPAHESRLRELSEEVRNDIAV
jgi:hypothetical protein